mgnify:CR=1 FL=1
MTDKIMALADAYADSRIDLHDRQSESFRSNRTADARMWCEKARAALLAALEAADRELEQLRSDGMVMRVSALNGVLTAKRIECDALRAENSNHAEYMERQMAELKAENKRLREALNYCKNVAGRPEAVYHIARAALENKHD